MGGKREMRWVDATGVHCEPMDVGWSAVNEEVTKALVDALLRVIQNATDKDFMEFAEACADHREIVFQE
jgi:hypothetical protein